MSGVFDFEAMRARLRAGLEQKGVSMRKASMMAGLGEAYVSGVLKEGKDPQISYLARVCDAVGLSLSWVLFGVELSPETERLIALIEANPGKRDMVLGLLG